MKVAGVHLHLFSALQGDDWLICTDSYAAWSSRLASAPPIDVVIPFFGSPHDLDELIAAASLWEGVRRVIVIDDCSPGHAGTPPASRDLVVVRSERNRGFVSSVNHGIRLADDADVVVLNSDAKAEGPWLRQLRVSAYAFDRVASVSPLSNAAGFFSVPNPRHENEPPQGIDGGICCGILNLITPRIHEEAVATSGFCWYLRRDALREVGLLDDRLIYRGYGEDNDFCRRASAMGFKNLCSLQTFVAHTRNKSFGLEKASLKRDNRKILDALDPGCRDAMEAYEEKSAVPGVGDAFGVFIASQGSRPIGDEIALPARYRILDDGEFGAATDWLELIPSQQTLRMRWRETTTALPVPHHKLSDFLDYLNLRFGISGVDSRADPARSLSERI